MAALKKGKSARLLLVIIAGCAILCCSVVATLAWITTNTLPRENVFTPAQVSCKVDETLTGNVKEDVKIQNTSNIDAWIRVELVFTRLTSDGDLLGTVVNPNDYTMSLNTTDWVLGRDGFYYYKYPVAPSEFTTVLVNSISPVDGLNLEVKILAEAIQAMPDRAVQEAWDCTVSNNVLQPN